MNDDDFHIRSLRNGSVTAVDACSRRSFARHAHDEFGVGVLTKGAQRSWSGRGPVEAISGNLITVNPAEMHDGAPLGSKRSWSMLYLSQPIVASIVADLTDGSISSRELHAPVVDDPDLARLFLATRRAALVGEQDGSFDERLVMLLGLLFGTAPSAATNISPRLARVRECIDDDPARPHALIDLAALAGLSRFQTVRAFARLTGFTPHAYVIQKRLDAARRQIRNGSTLANAAADAGFADQSHMHRNFVTRHGFTPGAYAAAFAAGKGATSFKSGRAVCR